MIDNETKERAKSQKTKIVEMLREAGLQGVLNSSFSKIALQYATRISELYRIGYLIQVEELGKGLVRYVLLAEPIKPIKIETAHATLMKKVKSLGYIDAETLDNIFKEYSIVVKYNGGTYKKMINQ